MYRCNPQLFQSVFGLTHLFGNAGEDNRSHSSLNWALKLEIIRGVAVGVEFLHSKQVIHRDLKPANILLDDSMTPKLTDFGLSRCFDENQSRHITTTILGTL